MNRLDNYYFDWLISRVCNQDEIIFFHEVLQYLYRTPFEWTIELDENMAIWGLELRNEYLESSAAGWRLARSYDFELDECSFLELLVSISCQIEDRLMQNDSYGNRTRQWFWVMMHNLGLDRLENAYWDEDKAFEIMEKFNKKLYSADGKGGLFCVKNSKIDMRTIPIWRQAGIYLSKLSLKNGEIY